MTDIYGNPEPRHIYVPVYPYVSARGTPFVKLGADFLDSAVFLLCAVFASLYGFGFAGFPTRSFRHDALAAAGLFLSMIAAAYWPSVRRIPAVGPLLYFLPGLALATLPFALDFILMFGR
jgi:hypothetical protein